MIRHLLDIDEPEATACASDAGVFYSSEIGTGATTVCIVRGAPRAKVAEFVVSGPRELLLLAARLARLSELEEG